MRSPIGGGKLGRNALGGLSVAVRFSTMQCMNQVITAPHDPLPPGIGLTAGGCVLLHCELHDAGSLMDRDAEGVQAQWTAFCHKAERLVSRHAGQVRRHYLLSWVADFDDARNALRVAWGLHAAARSLQQRSENLWLVRIGMHTSPMPWNSLGAHDPVLLRVAELAGLAGAGETVVSTTVRDRVVDGLDAAVEDLGDCMLKHVQVSERAFRAQAAPAPQAFEEPMPVDGQRPGLAVIPFRQQKPDELYAAVGDLLADRVIEQLSLSKQVRVIARLTGAAFRGRDQDTQLIRQHVPVRYVLTGRYRVVGSSLQGKLRLSASLTDTETGECVWTEPDLQGSVGDLLARQSELVHIIATGAHHAMLDTEVKVLQQQDLTSLDSYALMLGGIALMHRATRDDFHTSRLALDVLLERDPKLCAAHAWLAKWYVLRVTRGLTDSPRADAQEALAHARAAQHDAGARSLGLAMEGFVHLHLLRDFDTALQRIDQACRHNPSEPLAWLFGGVAHSFMDQADPAVTASRRALALSPLDPLLYYFESLAASSAIVAERHDEAIALCQRSLRRNLTHLHTHRALVTALWASGQHQLARRAAQRMLLLTPGYTVSAFRRTAASAETRFGRLMAEALQASGVPLG